MKKTRCEEIIKELEGKKTYPFAELVKLVTEAFGPHRVGKGSHQYIWKMPWAGNPRINLQPEKGDAKSYQIRQVIQALKKLNGG